MKGGIMKNKKGIQLNESFGAILTLVLIAVLIIIAIYMFSSLGTATMIPNTSGNAINESVANPSGASSHLSAVNLVSGSCGTITQIYNGTGGISINLGNYTQTGCVITNTTSQATYSSTLLISYPYTYTANSAATNATNDTITQFVAYPALVGLVGTIIFLGIVIGVLVASFVFGGRRGA
jgi:hypothetical protein